MKIRIKIKCFLILAFIIISSSYQFEEFGLLKVLTDINQNLTEKEDEKYVNNLQNFNNINNTNSTNFTNSDNNEDESSKYEIIYQINKYQLFSFKVEF